MQEPSAFATKQRLDILETQEFCQRLAELNEYRPAYHRQDTELATMAADYLHQLMQYGPEHSDPLQF